MTCSRRGSDLGGCATIIGSEREYRAYLTSGGSDGSFCGLRQKLLGANPHASWSMDMNKTMTGSTPASDTVQVQVYCVCIYVEESKTDVPGMQWMERRE